MSKKRKNRKAVRKVAPERAPAGSVPPPEGGLRRRLVTGALLAALTLIIALILAVLESVKSAVG